MTAKPGRWPLVGERLAALVDPRLTGAVCAGKAPMFDEELPGETVEDRHARWDAARALCRRCPVQSACRTAVREQDHPAGIWAGKLRNPAGTPGRPRKASA